MAKGIAVWAGFFFVSVAAMLVLMALPDPWVVGIGVVGIGGAGLGLLYRHDSRHIVLMNLVLVAIFALIVWDSQRPPDCDADVTRCEERADTASSRPY